MADTIVNLKAGTRWVLEDGKRLRLRKAKIRAGKMEIPEAMVLALALTEKAVDVGQGMVYYNQPHPRSDGFGRILPSSYFDAFITIKGVPELFYLPHQWTQEQKDAWRRLTPLQQLHRLDSRHGWLSDNLAIMPLVVNYRTEPQMLPTLDGYTASHLTVDLSPQHYLVGPTSDLRSLCNRMWQVVYAQASDRDRQPKGSNFVAKHGITWQDFRQWEVQGLDEVMRELDRVCRGTSLKSDIANPFQLLGSLRLDTIEAARMAHVYGQDYSWRGNKSNWKAVWSPPPSNQDHGTRLNLDGFSAPVTTNDDEHPRNTLGLTTEEGRIIWRQALKNNLLIDRKPFVSPKIPKRMPETPRPKLQYALSTSSKRKADAELNGSRGKGPKVNTVSSPTSFDDKTGASLTGNSITNPVWIEDDQDEIEVTNKGQQDIDAVVDDLDDEL